MAIGKSYIYIYIFVDDIDVIFAAAFLHLDNIGYMIIYKYLTRQSVDLK